LISAIFIDVQLFYIVTRIIHELITFPQIFAILENFGTEYIGGFIFMSKNSNI